jgi:hypothetical protein
MKNSILILVAFLCNVCYTQPSSANPSYAQDSVIIKDNVPAHQALLDSETIKAYQDILEKTNEQLSLWMNPYTFMVAVLALLFTILAIIAAYVIFRQGAEARQLIKDSITKHQVALENIMIEKQNQWKIYEANIENLILELQEKLVTADPSNTLFIREFLQKLELQKSNVEKEMITYSHSGWSPRDIEVQVEVNELTNFYLKVKLGKIGQEFCVYCKVYTNTNRSYWLGFGGNIKEKPERLKGEYTRHQRYSSDEITIQENISSAFALGFSQTNEKVVSIRYVRLRASDIIPTPISFEFKFA